MPAEREDKAERQNEAEGSVSWLLKNLSLGDDAQISYVKSEKIDGTPDCLPGDGSNDSVSEHRDEHQHEDGKSAGFSNGMEKQSDEDVISDRCKKLELVPRGPDSSRDTSACSHPYSPSGSSISSSSESSHGSPLGSTSKTRFCMYGGNLLAENKPDACLAGDGSNDKVVEHRGIHQHEDGKSTSLSNKTEKQFDEDVISEHCKRLELIPRGRIITKDMSARSHPYGPYSPSGSSISSSSESSHGSPLGSTSETRFCMYGGSLLAENKPDALDWHEQFSSRDVKNKQRYIHHNGGNVQLRDGHTPGPRYTPACVSLTAGAPPYVFHSISSFSSASSFSSDSSSPSPSTGMADSRDVFADSVCPKMKSIDDDFSASSWVNDSAPFPDELVEFIDNCCCKMGRDSVDNDKVQKQIVDMIEEANRSDFEIGTAADQQHGTLEAEKCANLVKTSYDRNTPFILLPSDLGGTTSILMPSSAMANCLSKPIAVVRTGKVQEPTQNSYSPPIVGKVVLENTNMNNVVYSVPVTKSNCRRTLKCEKPATKPLRPIAPKPIEVKRETCSLAVSSRKSKEKCAFMADGQIQELRASLLRTFDEDKRRCVSCHITQIPDEKITEFDEDGDTCLHIAIANSKTLHSVLLIDRFATTGCLDVHNNNGETPLFYAMYIGNVSLFRYLLAKGANPNAYVLDGSRTLLHFISEHGPTYLEFLNILCSHPNIKLDDYHAGQTPLLTAVACHNRCARSTMDGKSKVTNSLPVISTLLQHNASTMCADRLSGKTVYHLAVEGKSVRLLELLCRENRNTSREINTQAFDGNTALHTAATLTSCPEHVELVKVLIASGASLHVENLEHKKPFEMVEKNRKELKKILTLPRH